MQKDYITIAGQDYRLAINWNTIEDFLDRTGRRWDDIAKLGDLKGRDVTLLIECAVVEGERLEGHECTVTAKDIGAELSAEDVGAFMQLFLRYFSSGKGVEEGKGEAGDAKKKKGLISSR